MGERRPFTADEDSRLRRLWCAMVPARTMVAEMAPRSAAELLERIDALLGPDRPGFDADGIWRALELAELSLAGRARRRVPKDRLGWLLDGRPASDAMVVAAANVVRRHLGYPLIAWPNTVLGGGAS